MIVKKCPPFLSFSFPLSESIFPEKFTALKKGNHVMKKEHYFTEKFLSACKFDAGVKKQNTLKLFRSKN